MSVSETTVVGNPLEIIHQTLQATMTEYASRPVPAHYGDVQAEYHTLRTGVGLIDISAHGRIQVGGKERVQFLNGLVSNYIKPLHHGFGVPALFLTAQGKVIADCHIFGVDETFWIDLDATLAEKIYKSLFRFTFAGDFKVADLAKSYGLLSLQGPQASALLAAITGENPHQWPVTHQVDKVGGGTEDIPVLPLKKLQLGETEALVVRRARGTVDGYDLYIHREALAQTWNWLTSQGTAFHLRPVGWEALELVRVEAGLPRYGVDVDETVIALEANLGSAVSYHKGCYVGQETVAKIHWRGHDQVARKLTQIVIEGTNLPQRGSRILKGEKEVGTITSAIYSPQLGDAILALGYVRSSVLQAGGTLTIKNDDGTQVSAQLKDVGLRAED